MLVKMNCPITTTGGTAVPVHDWDATKSIQAVGVSALGTFDIEGCNDNNTWVKIGSTISGDGITAVTGAYGYLRLNTKSIVGTPVAATVYLTGVRHNG